MINNDTILVPIEQLAPSKLNPRQHFDEEHINRLAKSLAKDGLLENLIVRPRWCEGYETRKALDERRATLGGALEAASLPYGIVSGEGRWRAAKIAGLTELACRVRLLTDPELEELNLTEQLHRKELTPLEEAKSFARLLAYRNDDGTPRHTHESLAAAISMSIDVVYNRLQLLKLPEVATKALGAGKLGMTIASRIARIPDKAMAEAATKEILKGGEDGGPMSFREAETYIAENCMKELKGAPFDLDDETLVASQTSCTKCPFRTGNNKALFGDVKRGDVCTRPACYKAKVEAAFDRTASQAQTEGCEVLTAEESMKVFPAFGVAGALAFNSAYAKLDDVPAAHLLKAVVKEPPTWETLVGKLEKAGMRPKVYLAQDQAGRAVKLVKVEQIIAGAEKAGEPIFAEKGGSRRPPSEEDVKMREENKRLAAEAALREKVLIEAVRQVHAALAQMYASNPGHVVALGGVWEIFLWGLSQGDPASTGSWRLITKMLKVSDSTALNKAVAAMPSSAKQALCALVFLGTSLLDMGLECATFKKLAEFVRVDLKQIDKDLRVGIPAKPAVKKPAKTAKAKRPKKVPDRTVKKHAEAGARAVAAVKGSMKTKPTKKGGAS